MSMRQPDIEALRSILSDKRMHNALALVKKVEVLTDRSKCRVLLEILPDKFEVVATCGWAATGPDAGIFSVPVVGDLVLVAYVDRDTVFVTSRLTSPEDKIPSRALTGDMVAAALSGKGLHLTSTKGVYIGRAGASDPSEPTVLGNVMKTALGDLLDKFTGLLDTIISGPLAIDSMGGSAVTHPTLVTSLNSLKTQVATLKSTYVSTANTNIVSQHSFVER